MRSSYNYPEVPFDGISASLEGMNIAVGHDLEAIEKQLERIAAAVERLAGRKEDNT